MQEQKQGQRAGWPIPDWCYQVGICRAGFYNLAIPPDSVKLGKRRIVRESPDAYLARIAEAQGTPAS